MPLWASVSPQKLFHFSIVGQRNSGTPAKLFDDDCGPGCLPTCRSFLYGSCGKANCGGFCTVAFCRRVRATHRLIERPASAKALTYLGYPPDRESKRICGSNYIKTLPMQ